MKFLFTEDKLEAIEKFIVSKGGIRRQHLQAIYIDTPDFLLTQSGIAFRLRKEGRQWIQTLKVSTPNLLERLEHNVTLSVSGSAIPNWDIELHQDHEAGNALKKCLPKLQAKDLQASYQTDIWRRKALVKTRSGLIEYALDLGFIQSNQSTGASKTVVQELEIELKAGPSSGLLLHAQNIIKRYGAYIDTQSKSERGFLLARSLQASPPVRAKSISLRNIKSDRSTINLLIHSCLSQVLPNQSVLNSESVNPSEYLHQLRVGLRRLKVLFKYLARHDVCVGEAGLEVFKKTFDALGEYRDSDYLTGVLNPILQSLGGPEIKLGAIRDLPNPSHITRNKDFQLLLIEIMSLEIPALVDPLEEKNTKESSGAIKKTAVKLLDSTFSFIATQVPRFSVLEDEAIHTLRKKMKFMRYSLEFYKDYCNKKYYREFFKSISITLDHFGLFNDICVSISRIESLTKGDPTLLFALGWLKAERQRVRSLCEKSVKKLIQNKLAWRV
ncbi:CHAD domain-containing protein [Polynucleobacter sp. AM-25C3]|uniref:CYTH and CHAD domain-containing protein n=1 Tax=Polynucleobacter sp. AM-25C3 TaxID=1855569 RepID=UPI001C0B59E0|nr:CHAD domain-containing protein [Polynucleobacter sp. AM-25C3]MBU3601820.1 CHAD domain-containing protein [Polynucleobacter sp. AM-25C3]